MPLKFSTLLFLLMLISPLPALAAESVFTIGNGMYNINGHVKEDQAPYIKNGRTYLPLRYAAYAVGIGDNSIYWDQDNKIAYLSKDDRIIAFPIGSTSFKVGNEILYTDAPAEISNGRTMLPIRVIAEALECDVRWNPETKQVTVIDKSNE